MADGAVMRVAATWVALAGALATPGCVADEGRPPIARVVLAPEAIPENDGFQTAVTLDATSSADPVDDPDGSDRLTYVWAIAGDEFRFDAGDAADPTPVVRFRGDRPATITLTVTDRDGLEASATVNLQLTVR